MTDHATIPASLTYPKNDKRTAHRGSNVSPTLWTMLALANRFTIGQVLVELPDGRVEWHGVDEGPAARLNIHNPRVARRLLSGGNVGFAESYMDGDWDSPDLAELLTIAALNIQALDRSLRGSHLYRAYSKLVHHRRRNTEKGSRQNISQHYDLGNDFYSAWLDPSMTYSAGIFTTGTDTLEQSQTNKYARLADQLDLQPGHHVLEIGCGWGGFAEYAAKERGAQVKAITISKQQKEFAEKRIFDAGLSEKVSIDFCDYRHLEGTYDRIASIEMFEAVGQQFWPVYFERLNHHLSDNGRAALQIITIADDQFEEYTKRPDFIQRYIFPGGMLPSPQKLNTEFDRAGLVCSDWFNFGEGYARTLEEWNTRFHLAWPDIKNSTYDNRFKRMWNYYFAYCIAGFRAKTIDVCQIRLQKA